MFNYDIIINDIIPIEINYNSQRVIKFTLQHDNIRNPKQ